MQSIYRSGESKSKVPRLALKPQEAALALGFSAKALWDRTFPRGDIPAIKVGTRTAYFVHQLQAWADREYERQQAEVPQQAEKGCAE